jgi:hypothetical protein
VGVRWWWVVIVVFVVNVVGACLDEPGYHQHELGLSCHYLLNNIIVVGGGVVVVVFMVRQHLR